MITISICMIVKNEEKILKRCLDSIADLAEEIIIVDTGSTDRTKEIAGQYTDRIYDFAWIDDFSAARNYAFSKATMDYIYSADADEVLDEENRRKFVTLKETLLPEIDMVQMYYANQLAYDTVYNYDKEYRPKLFKRLRTFQWVNPIHETIAMEPVIYDSDIEILHLPQEGHGKRDLQNFAKQIHKGRRLSAHLLNMYARELLMAGEEEDLLVCEDYFRLVIQEEGRSQKELQEAFCVLSKVAAVKQDTALMLEVISKGFGIGQCAELCYYLGNYYEKQGHAEEALMWYYNAAYETEPVLVKKCGDRWPLAHMAELYHSLGLSEQEEEIRAQLQQSEL